MTIELRNVLPGDMDTLRRWRNNPAVAECMYTDHHITEEEHQKWFTAAMADTTRRYLIVVADGRDTGLLYLYNIDHHNQRCYWGYYIGEEGARGKGIGSLVEYQTLSLVFDELKLNKVCCEVLASNMPVVNLHKGFGFREEGVFRQHVFKQGSFHDIYCLAMLREEWEQQKLSIKQRLVEKQRRVQGATEPAVDNK